MDYQDATDDAPLLDATKAFLARGDAAFITAHNAMPLGSGTGLWPLPYNAPFLTSHLDDLGLFAPSKQRTLFRILEELHLFNEQVAVVRQATERTFDSSLSKENYAVNDANLKAGTEKLATRASLMIAATDRFLDSKGNVRD